MGTQKRLQKERLKKHYREEREKKKKEEEEKERILLLRGQIRIPMHSFICLINFHMYLISYVVLYFPILICL